MKKIAGFVLGLAASSSAFAADLDAIVKNVQAVCQSPSQQGKYWNVSTGIDGGVNGIIRLVNIGINGEATFTKGEWEGVQQVLKEHQAGDNESYRKCAEKLTPIFLEKFAPATSENPNNEKSTASKTASQNTQSFGDITGGQNFIQNGGTGDTNINFGSKKP
ncbi:MAG: hypothetical protein QX189_18810 [Methylococcales bacterium]